MKEPSNSSVSFLTSPIHNDKIVQVFTTSIQVSDARQLIPTIIEHELAGIPWAIINSGKLNAYYASSSTYFNNLNDRWAQ